MSKKQPEFCHIDVDIDGYRSKLALAAAFVDATNTRYGFSSKDLRCLGGSEISRIEDLIVTDHEWSSRVNGVSGVKVRPPREGNRIILKLYWKTAPLACENFSTLCSNGEQTSNNTTKKKKPAPIGECGKPLTYKDCVVHRVEPGFVMQGGDFVFGNGSGGESVYNGKKFKDERAGLLLRHDRKGILSMGNSGKNSNTSQFFITFGPAPQCDGKHVIFGEVVSGWEVIAAVEAKGTKSGTPCVPVTITSCGIYEPLVTPSAGYWFDQPDDSFSGSSPIFMCRPRVAILVPSFEIGKKFERAIGIFATPTIISLGEKGKDDIGTVIENGECATNYINILLDSYAIDLVIIAPSCKEYTPKELPPSWKNCRKDLELCVSDIVITTKPVACLQALKNSWIKRTDWNLAIT